jgi:uncharacterized OB-fold protein
MAFKVGCPNCGYMYRPRSANTCCPRCKTRPTRGDVQASAVMYLIGMFVAFALVAIIHKASGR